MGPEIQSCDWWTQKKGPMPDLDSFPLVPKGPIVSQTLIQLNTRVGLQTSEGGCLQDESQQDRYKWKLHK